MPTSTKPKARNAGPGWLVTLLGVAFLVSTGFLLGIVVGVVSEEPELVVSHLTRPSESVPWLPGPQAPQVEPVAGPAREPALGTHPPRSDARRTPRPTAVAAAPPARTQGAYAVQVGAFRDSSAAEVVAEGLREKGFPVYVTPAPSSTDGRWRVRVGPVSSRPQADHLARRLKLEEKLPTWVLSE